MDAPGQKGVSTIGLNSRKIQSLDLERLPSWRPFRWTSQPWSSWRGNFWLWGSGFRVKGLKMRRLSSVWLYGAVLDLRGSIFLGPTLRQQILAIDGMSTALKSDPQCLILPCLRYANTYRTQMRIHCWSNVQVILTKESQGQAKRRAK